MYLLNNYTFADIILDIVEKRTYTKIALVLTSVFLLLYKPFGNLEKQISFENLQLSSLVQRVPIHNSQSFKKLYENEPLYFEFQANDNYLGTIGLLIDNYSKRNSDVFQFKIKEKGSDDWHYSSSYEIALMDVGQYFPFGFPPIRNSINRTYQIEIRSSTKKNDDAISISASSEFFQAKYDYPKSLLIHNKTLIPHFVVTKIANYTRYLRVIDYIYFLLLLAFPYFLLKKKNNEIKTFRAMDVQRISGFLKKNIQIISIETFYVATHLQFLKYTQYWDANWYWSILQQSTRKLLDSATSLTSIFSSFIENFNFIGHPSMAYTGLLGIGQIIGDGSVVTLNTVNMVLAMLAIWAFYNIVSVIFPSHRYENILITLIFAFNPLFYATSISLNLDFPLLVFTVLMVESYIKERKILFLIWSLFLVFSKETGLVIYLSFYLGNLIFNLIKKNMFTKRKELLKTVLYFTVPIIFFGLYLINSRGILWNDLASKGFDYVWGNNCYFCFGYRHDYVLRRLFQIFIMNFSWIMSAFITIYLYTRFILRSKSKIIVNNYKNIIQVLIFVFVCFVIFNSITIVMIFPRYVVAGVFFFIMIFYASYLSLFRRRGKVRRNVLVIIFMLMFIQTFWSIDPVPRILYGTTYMGRNISFKGNGYNDGLVYNTQFVFVDGLTKVINDDVPSGTGLIIDNATSYFWKDLNIVGRVEDLPALKDAGHERLRYVFIPWMSHLENELYNYINVLYVVKDSKFLDYRGYYVQVFDIEAISN